MGTLDVAAEKAGRSLDNDSSDSGGSSGTTPPGTAPSVTLSLSDRDVTLDALTLVLYGVALADILLLYIAIRV